MHRYSWQFRLVFARHTHFFLIQFFSLSLSFLAKATYAAMAMTYSYLTPDLWKETVYTKTPFQEYSSLLANTAKKYTSGVGDKHYQ